MSLFARFRKILHSKQSVAVTDLLIILAVVGTVGFAVAENRRQASLEATVCRAPAQAHELTLQNDSFSEKSLVVNLCDTVRITNKDTQQYALNFGTHEEHIAYPGFQSLVQGADEAIVIDALQTGSYRLHDHLRDKAVLELHVRPKR